MVLPNEAGAARLWISRDASGSGMYSLWTDAAPELGTDGYYKAGKAGMFVSMLLMCIHPIKFPWTGLILKLGEYREIQLSTIDQGTKDNAAI